MTAGGPCRALVVGDPRDAHVALVLEHLPAAGTVLVDADAISSLLVEHDQNGWALRDLSGQPVVVADDVATRGWIRRYSPPEWDHGVRIGSHRAAVLTARLALLGALLRDRRVEWLTSVDRMSGSENKLAQYAAAESVGARVPRTIVTRDVDHVASVLGEPFVVKPLGAAHFDRAGQAHIAYAEPVRAADLAGVDLLEAPFLMQELLRAQSHLRVVTVAERTWACEQSADGLPVDWRRADRAHDGFVVTQARADISELAHSLASAMGVGYSSQDWVVDDRGPCFLDLNPAGQWAFLPSLVADDVTQAIADWLGGADRRG